MTTCDRVSRDERATRLAAQMMCDPRVAEVLAAQLDEQTARHRYLAAHARTRAVRCEQAGDEASCEVWVERADEHEAHARSLTTQRDQLIARFGRRQPAAAHADVEA